VRHYERQTSIEFVVVIAPSLEGQKPHDYAVGIGNFWGIGKAGRDNGIVLLWAPNLRAYSFRVAAGLSPDLSDADAKKITNENLLPNFKRGEYYLGLKETVVATMEHLGNKSWEARLQARQQAEKQASIQATIDRKQRAEQAWQAELQSRRQAEEDQKARAENGRLGIGFLLVVAICVGGGTFIYRSRHRKAERAEMALAAAAVADNLAAAEKNAPEVQRLLDDFAKESPEQDISQLRESLAGQPDRILKVKVDAQLVDFTKLDSYHEMVRVRANSESESNLLDSTSQSIAQIRQAKAQSQAMMEQLSRERFEIIDVRDSSRTDEVNRLLLNSRQQYEQARQGSSMSVVDWMIVNRMLNESHQQMQQAVQCSQQEPYAPSFATLDDSSSSSSSGSSYFGGSSGSSSSSSSSSSSESFSSSSSSGGGGGFSSGSGSDGSY
ncbi:MAG TPA: TPM domain-containing protein, partial [Candidatus Angelobacter sp.]|nr:TPM domain-containing protein [Candidatus Angelobacter sp.]